MPTISTASPFSVAQQYFIDQYRTFLSYRRQAVAGGAFVLPSTPGDEELWQDLRLGMNLFNMTPPIITTWQFADLYVTVQHAADQGVNVLAPTSEDSTSIYTTAVFYCALFNTGLRLQWFEAGKHFRYSDNGITIERVKQGDYQNMIAGQILTFISTQLPALRKVLGYSRISPKGQFSGMISLPRSLTRGLRGTRIGMG